MKTWKFWTLTGLNIAWVVLAIIVFILCCIPAGTFGGVVGAVNGVIELAIACVAEYKLLINWKPELKTKE